MKPITFYYVVCHWSTFNEVSRRFGQLNVPHCGAAHPRGWSYKKGSSKYYCIWGCSQRAKVETVLRLSINDLSEEITAITDFTEIADRLGVAAVRVLIGRSDSEMAHCLEKQLNYYLFMQGA